MGGQVEISCNLADLYTMEDMLDGLRRCNEMPGRGEDNWVTGGVWDREPFENGVPDKGILDSIIADRPAVLESSDGHAMWVNSRALELAGIDRDTPDPAEGEIVRDPETGEPTGIFNEQAMSLIGRVVPVADAGETMRGMKAGIAQAHQYGITSVIDPGLNAGNIAPYVELSRSGQLKVRTLLALSPVEGLIGAFGSEVFDMIASREQFRGPNLSPDSVKFFMDGVLETGTALLVDPYINAEFDRSVPFYPQETLNDFFTRIDADGLQIHAHAIGDGAVRSALDAFEVMRASNGPSDNRHQIVHLQLIHPDDIPRFAELDISANFQAVWAWPDNWITELNLPELGQQRVDRMYPIASVQQAGGRIIAGSDWYVSSLNPLQAIEVAVRRQDPDQAEGDVLNAGERVDLATMIAAYTINGAYTMKQEERVGSVETGKRADLVVLDRNLFEIPATEINQVMVEMTYFDGELVYKMD
jgi:predicted amidohydrolase YtcJ